MDKPSSPTPPDYTGAANAQGQANLSAARQTARMSNPNIINPLGRQTVTWSSGEENPAYQQALQAWQHDYDLGRADWLPAGAQRPQASDYSTPTVTQSLNPEMQGLYDQQVRIGQSLGNTAEQGLSRVNASMSTPFNMQGVPDRVTGINQQNYTSSVSAAPVRFGTGYSQPIMFGLGDAGQIQRGFADVGGPQRNLADAGQVQDQFGDAGRVQTGLDFSGAPRLPGADDFSADRRRVEQAIYSRLEPQLGLDRERLRTQLINTGFRPGTDAYAREMDRADRQANDARMQAVLAGGGEQSRLFGLGMQARQQDVGERTTAGNFANAAQAQAYAQAIGRGQFANTAQQQRFGQNLASGQFANEAQRQAYQQALERGTFANTAQAQQFAQNLAGGQFANQAQQQGYLQAQGDLAAYNAAQGQQFGQGLTNAQLGNQVSQARTAEELANANLANQGRQQSIQEQAYLRSLPLQELNALRTGAQPTMPQFQGYQPVSVQASPIFGAAQAQAASDMNRYNQQVAQQNAMMQGLFALGGASLVGAGEAGGFGKLFRLGGS